MILSTLALPVALGSLMALDYGNEFFKVSVIQPGRPIEIASNVHSQRKTETGVSFYDRTRLFGADAGAHQLRAYKGVYFTSNRILGHHAKAEENFLGIDTNYIGSSFIVNKTRESVIYDIGEGISPEELHAHIFNYARKIAEDANDQREIKDIVIGIPSDATQRVRQAYIDAAEIAGMKPQLIHGTVAASIQLALDWAGSTTQNYLFYNMGSRTTEVCIVEFSARAAGMVAGRTAPALHVKSCVVDSQLGGLFGDIAIADAMLVAFKEKHANIAKGIDTNARARRKLLAQAKKTKHILSANKRASFNIASFHEDVDFQANIERSDFEDWIQEPIFNRLTPIVEKALGVANMTKNDIDQVELIGGSWRIPKVLDTLGTYFKNPEKPSLELGQHLNGEEAMVMGAALFGANSSSVFRVKRIFLQDVARYNYSMDILNSQGEEIRNRTVLATAFNTKLNFKKKISLANHTENFIVKLYEDEALLSTYNMDVASIMAKVEITENTTQKVSFMVRADESGLIALTKPEVVTEKTYEVEVEDETIMKLKLQMEVEKLYEEWARDEELLRLANMTDEEKAADELKKKAEAEADAELTRLELEETRENLKKKKNSDEKKNGDDKKDGVEKKEGEDDKKEGEEDLKEKEVTDDKKDDAEEKKKRKEAKKRKDKLVKERELKRTQEKLKKDKKLRELAAIAKVEKVFKTVTKKKKDNLKIVVETDYSKPVPLDDGGRAQAEENLARMEKQDKESLLIDELKNTLESTVYSSREKMEDAVIQKVMQEEDRNKILTLSTETEEWLYGEGTDADLETYTKRLASFEDLMKPALARAHEIEKRPEVQEKVEGDFAKIAEYQTACKSMDWLNSTKVELAEKKLAEFKTFWEDAVAKQKGLKDHEDPAYTSADVAERISKVVKAWAKLKKTKKPKDVKTAVPKGVKLNLKGKTLEQLNDLLVSTILKKNDAVLKQDYDTAHLAKLEEEQINQAIKDFDSNASGAAGDKAEEKKEEEKASAKEEEKEEEKEEKEEEQEEEKGEEKEEEKGEEKEEEKEEDKEEETEEETEKPHKEREEL